MFQALAGDVSSFTLDKNTGVLSVTKTLDFEATQFYLFHVVVTVKMFTSVSY